MYLRIKISRLFNCALDLKLQELKVNKKDFRFEVDLKYVSDKEIKNLNNEYRSVNKETDVLSFPIIDFANGEKIVEKYNMLGDIVICKEVAKKQAKKYRHSVKREICFLALHGFLHLLGYDHIESKDEKVMMAIAKNILEKNKIYK